MEKIELNGKVYILESDIPKQTSKATLKKGMKYCIIRTYSAGVFAGYIQSRKGQEVVLRNARRLWYWDGAASLSQLAVDGVSKPQNCKFPCEVDEIELLQVIEIIECTNKAKESIDSVKIRVQ